MTDERDWRCRHGFHRWTVIPLSTLRMTQSLGWPIPDWYIGGAKVAPYCARCKVRRDGSERTKTLAAIVDRTDARLASGQGNPFADALAVTMERTTGPDTIDAAKADYAAGRIEADLLEYRVGRILERESNITPDP